MRSMQNLAKKRPGITSLLVVVGLALLLVGIISGVTVLSVREQRQATDTDQSNRAVQAAEASAREAAQALLSDPNIERGNCSNTAGTLPEKYTPTNQPAGSDLQVVCRTIKSQADTIEGQLNTDGATEFLLNIDNVQTINLRWLKRTATSTVSIGNLYPAKSGYPANAASAMEITFFSWPKNLAGFGTEGIATKTYILVPGANNVNVTADAPAPQTNPGTVCNTAFVDYQCAATLNVQNLTGFDPTTYQYAVRVTARYKGTDFNARFFKNTGQPANVRSSKAIIDVTARSGNLYRRIVAEKPIGELGFVNSVLGSATNICKNLAIVTQPSRSIQGAGNNCQGQQY